MTIGTNFILRLEHDPRITHKYEQYGNDLKLLKEETSYTVLET